MSHKQQAEHHLKLAQVLQGRLDRIETIATATAMGEDAGLARRLVDDPGDFAAKNELSYRVGLLTEKYGKAMGSMAGNRDRHLQWAQTHALLALVEEVGDTMAEPHPLVTPFGWIPPGPHDKRSTDA